MPRKNADERPLYWSTDAEGFLLERLYEYHCANHGKQPKSRHYNQWAIQMATYFDGYVPANERLKEKRRRLSKVYAMFKMLQDHSGVGWDSINNTFTCSEDMRKNLSKEPGSKHNFQYWLETERHALGCHFSQSSCCYWCKIIPPHHGTRACVPPNEVGARNEEPQNEQNSLYQNSDDDGAHVDFGRRVERQRRENATNVASSSRTIRKRSTRARKSNDNTREELLEAVLDMRNDLWEDIRSTKESLPSDNTVNGRSEASMIIASLVEMGLDPRTRVLAYDKIAKDAAWRPIWQDLDDSSRRAFLETFVQVPQPPNVRNPYCQPPPNFSQVPNPYSQQHTPFGHPQNSFHQPPNLYNQQPPPFGQPPNSFNEPPNPYTHPPTP